MSKKKKKSPFNSCCAFRKRAPMKSVLGHAALTAAKGFGTGAAIGFTGVDEPVRALVPKGISAGMMLVGIATNPIGTGAAMLGYGVAKVGKQALRQRKERKQMEKRIEAGEQPTTAGGTYYYQGDDWRDRLD